MSADYKQIGRRCLVFVAQEYRHLILKYACYKIKLKVIGKSFIKIGKCGHWIG